MATASTRVLISEAEPDVRRLLAAMVERLGHDAAVLPADVVVPPRADVLLVDPLGPTGLQHARLVRAFFPDLPIVCLDRLLDAAGLLGRGRLSLVSTPFSLARLAEALDDALAPAASNA